VGVDEPRRPVDASSDDERKRLHADTLIDDEDDVHRIAAVRA
jgi:hypothetical protein